MPHWVVSPAGSDSVTCRLWFRLLILEQRGLSQQTPAEQGRWGRAQQGGARCLLVLLKLWFFSRKKTHRGFVSFVRWSLQADPVLLSVFQPNLYNVDLLMFNEWIGVKSGFGLPDSGLVNTISSHSSSLEELLWIFYHWFLWHAIPMAFGFVEREKKTALAFPRNLHFKGLHAATATT